MKPRSIRRLSTPTLTLPHQGGGILRVIGQPPKGILEWYLSKPQQSMRLFPLKYSEIFEIDGHKVFPYHAILDKCLHHDNFSLLD
jgi:hypothetical protein